MGLLSDPEYGSQKWVRILKKIHSPLCFVCYIAAIAWFFMLANKEFNNETYFSENALLPGLVKNKFNAEQSANQFFREFLQELEEKYYESDKMPIPWLVGKMSQLHLEVYTHNFTLHYPLGQGQVFKGTNVYGILRAPRASSLEAIVVSAPYRSLSNHQKGTAAGIALMLAFAQFARPQIYWAKDIIFLITEHEQLGMQAWLEAYHGLHRSTPTFYTSLGNFWHPGSPLLDIRAIFKGYQWLNNHNKCLDPGTLKGRSGSIQAAINLEFHTPKFKYVEVKVEGLNGQLPNLDLVNLVHKLCDKSGIHHSYKNSYSWIRARNNWVNSIYTMLGMVSTQLAGVPNGNHGLFHQFGIESVTLEGRDANDPAGIPPRVQSLPSSSFYRLGITLESILRSLNNLLERFHQSYFFYMLAATNRFISIGQYMPSLCLLCGAMLVRALALWVTLQKDIDEYMDKDTEDEKDKIKDVNEKKDSDSDDIDEQSDKEGEIDNNKKKDDVKDIDEQSDIKVEKDKIKDINEKKDSDEDDVKNDIDEQADKDDEKDKIKDNSESEDEVKDMREFKNTVEKKGILKKDTELNLKVTKIVGNYLIVHILGYIVMNLPVMFTHFGSTFFDLPSEQSVFYGLILTCVMLTLTTPYLLNIGSVPLTFEEISMVNILLLIELSTACLAIGMHNFPLGLCLGVAYTPLALLVGVVGKDLNRKREILLFIKRVVCLLLHPLLLVVLGLTVYSRVLFPEEAFLSMVSRGRDAAMQAIMFSIVDSLIYGNWLFNVASLIILPTWILFWQLLCNRVAVL